MLGKTNAGHRRQRHRRRCCRHRCWMSSVFFSARLALFSRFKKLPNIPRIMCKTSKANGITSPMQMRTACDSISYTMNYPPRVAFAFPNGRVRGFLKLQTQIIHLSFRIWPDLAASPHIHVFILLPLNTPHRSLCVKFIRRYFRTIGNFFLNKSDKHTHRSLFFSLPLSFPLRCPGLHFEKKKKRVFLPFETTLERKINL